MQLLEGRKAVVTGGSRGIGREICLLLAENGADVALAYRKSAVEAEQLREEIAAMGRSCIAVQADVSVSADVDRFVTQAAQALGGIDILVNCAGVFPQALIEDITDEDWSRVMRINLDGAFYACRAAAPYLKKSGKNGRIINLSSQAALNGTAHGVHYGASKAALLGLTYCLAKELGPDGITVNAILPGRIDTEMLAYAGTPGAMAAVHAARTLRRHGGYRRACCVPCLGQGRIYHGCKNQCQRRAFDRLNRKGSRAL